uniref:Ras-related protein Rab-33B n=1 Tax=Pavo cristatus TaxID=9049 RepID=A0A8C9FZR6_PAVCR
MAAELESSLELSFTGSGTVPGGGLPPARSRIFKIIVIGDSNVGKTCLTYRFCAGRFPQRTEATIGVDFRERAVTIDGERIKPAGWSFPCCYRTQSISLAAGKMLRHWQYYKHSSSRRGSPTHFFTIPRQEIQLWDTAGQERFRKSMVQHYYRNVHAVVFVYDMTNIASFHSLPSWIEECKQHLLANDIPRILVGNKCDLRNAIQFEQSRSHRMKPSEVRLRSEVRKQRRYNANVKFDIGHLQICSALRYSQPVHQGPHVVQVVWKQTMLLVCNLVLSTQHVLMVLP